jgi:prepilin-type processing-associated H-X9-DG protein
LLPALGNARKASQSVACLSNLHQIGMAAAMYASDYQDTVLPAFPKYSKRALIHTPPGSGSWAYVLCRYMGRDEIKGFYSLEDAKPFVCPSMPTRIGYGHNLEGMGWGTTKNDVIVGFKRTSDILQPGLMVHIIDCYSYTAADPTLWGSWLPHVRWPGQLIDVLPDTRHPSDSANILFADAHAANDPLIPVDLTSQSPHWLQ